MATETTTLGGGCFWCLEAVYEMLQGVESVQNGYAGGHTEHPSYEEVCSDTTGHAEVVQVVFDPDVISFREILEVFFTIHDPTTLNRQGHDVGSQYRSAIFTHSDEQRETAEAVIAELTEQELWSDPIVTQIEPLTIFYPAEDYHAQYFRRNPSQPYCQIVVAPKVVKARQHFTEKLRA